MLQEALARIAKLEKDNEKLAGVCLDAQNLARSLAGELNSLRNSLEGLEPKGEQANRRRVSFSDFKAAAERRPA